MGESSELPYSDGSITVDGDYVRIGQRSYLVSEITGLEVTTTAPHSPLWAIAALGLGLFTIVTQIFKGHHYQAFIIGFLLVGGGIWQWNRSKLRLSDHFHAGLP